MTHVFEHVISIRKQVSVRKFGFIIAHNKNDIRLQVRRRVRGTLTSSCGPDSRCTYCRLQFLSLDNLHRRILVDLGSDSNHDWMKMILAMTAKLMEASMVDLVSVSLLMSLVEHRMALFLVFEVVLYHVRYE